jgi:hypothetical protein
VLNPLTTLAIILGVSECPRAPKLQPLPQCANSAKDFENYLRSSLGLARQSIINLFNSETSASDQLDQIEDWVVRHTTGPSGARATDLLVYYTGHGGFARNDQSYFLAIRKTREGSEGATSIRYSDFASILKRNATTARKYLILDCCFAAAAVLKTQADIHEVVVQRVEDELPPSGTAVLCSSAAKLLSIAPPGERHTMFSGALLKCLHEGIPKGSQAMTLEDVGKAARKIIQDKYPIDAVRPELHVPEQARGNPAQVPLFPNVLWKAQSPDEQPSNISSILSPIAEGSLITAVRSYPGRMSVGALSGALSALSIIFTPIPFGLVEVNASGLQVPPRLAPIAPAFFLAGSIVLVLGATSRITWRSIALIPFVTYLSWSLAWLFLYQIARWGGIMMYPIYSGASGYIGSLLLFLGLIVILRGVRAVYGGILWVIARASVVLALWAAIAGIPVVLYDNHLSLTHVLGLFIPWQGWYVSTLSLVVPESDYTKLQRPHFFWWLAGSVLLTTALVSSPIRVTLDQLTLAPSIVFTVKSATSEPVKSNQSHIVVTYDIAKIKISEELTCNIELRTGGKIYEGPTENFDTDQQSAKAELTIPEKIVTAKEESDSSVWVRAFCHIFFGREFRSGWETVNLRAAE